MSANMHINAYIAGPYDMRSDLNGMIEEFPAWLHSTSRWIANDYEKQQRGLGAVHDLQDVDKADAIICFAAQRGWGHALEIGYAIAKRKLVLIVQQDGDAVNENVFMYHPSVHLFPSLGIAIDWLDRWRENNRPPLKVGDRVEDGGVMGTIIHCEMCGGSGQLHQPDEMPDFSTPQEMPDYEVTSVVEAGEMPDRSFLFMRILDRMLQLHLSKNSDYGTGEDPWANLRGADEFGVPNWIGAAVRANDKVARIKTAATRSIRTGSTQLAHESIIDSFRDAANYFVIAEVLYREWLDEMGYDRIGDAIDAEYDQLRGLPESVAKPAHDVMQKVTGAVQ